MEEKINHNIQKLKLDDEATMINTMEITTVEIDLPVREYNLVVRAGMKNIYDILCFDNLENIRNIKSKDILTIKTSLLKYGINLDDKKQCEELKRRYNHKKNMNTVSHLEKNESIEKILNLTIEDLNVSMGVFNCVKRAGINTAYDVVERENIRSIRNFGTKRFEELKQKFIGYGIDLDDRVQCNELIKKYDALNPKENKEDWEKELELEDSNNVLENKVEEKKEILKGLEYQLKRKQYLELKLLECDEEFKKLMKQYELSISKESGNSHGTK